MFMSKPEEDFPNSEVIDILSDRHNKLVQLRQTPDGNKLVARIYGSKALADMYEDGEFTFTQADETFRSFFEEAGIRVLDTTQLAGTEQNFDTVVVVEYLENLIPLAQAQTSTKVSLAERLPKLMRNDGIYGLHYQAVGPRTFDVIKDSEGNEEVVVVDTDPYLQRKSVTMRSFWIERLSDLLWNACDESEREEVLTAFIMSLSDELGDDLDTDPSLLDAFADAHLMSNGVHPRQMRSYGSDYSN